MVKYSIYIGSTREKVEDIEKNGVVTAIKFKFTDMLPHLHNYGLVEQDAKILACSTAL